MNTFIVDRHTDPTNPTVSSVQCDRIPVYDSVACACADIANLQVGQIILTKDEDLTVTGGLAANLKAWATSAVGYADFASCIVNNL